MKDNLDQIHQTISSIKSDDIPGLGNLLNLLSETESIAKQNNNESCLKIILAIQGYIEKLIFEEVSDLEPIQEGIELLQAMWQALDKGQEFAFDTDDILEMLQYSAEKQDDEKNQEAQFIETEIHSIIKFNEDDLQVIGDFINESRENLASIEINLVELEQDPTNKDIINAIFRPFHTIKGVSGFLELKKINKLSHSTENLLDSARNGEFIINNEVTDIILGAVDTLKKLIDNIEHALASGQDSYQDDVDINPLLSKITEVENDLSQLGMLQEFIDEGASSDDLKQEFSLEDDTRPLGEMLLDKGVIQEQDLEDSLKKQRENYPGKKIGEILVGDKKAKSSDIIAALSEQKKLKRISTLQVKVDTDKLDNLVDLTGELVISQSMLRQNQVIIGSNDQKLYQNLSQLAHIVSSIQRIAMSMRMVPIKSTFQKMVRLVRDLARNSDKEINLKMFGEETEIDRNVVDQLYEPMVHMIRNAADHGIESTEDRIKTGKDPQGIIQLKAYHRGGNIVIEIKDDGKGLDKNKILEKAINSNIISGDSNLSENEIYNLIMQPGFSTAQKVTDISGRGVGMDVVKQGIEKLRGRIDIKSEMGKGSSFIISLPLTLAIIEGMLVRVGQERYIIPTMTILESFRPNKKECYTVKGHEEMVMVRNNLIPLIRLHRIFRVKGDSENPWDGLVVVVENKDKKRAILLDELLGKEEFVIKTLGESLKGIKGLAGGAILGDGRVGLILDIAGLFELSLQ